MLALIGGTILLGVFGPENAYVAMFGILGAAVRDYFGTRISQNQADGPALPPPA